MPTQKEYRYRKSRGLCSACGLRPAQAGRKCLPCRALHSMQKRQKRRDNKAKAIEYKGGKCSECGSKFDYVEVYDFHHRDSADKELNISSVKGNHWDNVEKELDKCDLLCANCHRIIHARRRDAAAVG